MTKKRTITATAPDGQSVSVNVGPTRAVGAIRITGFTCQDGTTEWMVTVHKTLLNAIAGPNQTPAWNNKIRWAIAIDAADQAAGGWAYATK
jgi:hypothetical protein